MDSTVERRHKKISNRVRAHLFLSDRAEETVRASSAGPFSVREKVIDFADK